VVAAICIFVKPVKVLIAAVTTLSMFVGLTGLACYRPIDKLSCLIPFAALLSFSLIPMILFMIFLRS
jgi:FtsH-binding integral membrane protein